MSMKPKETSSQHTRERPQFKDKCWQQVQQPLSRDSHVTLRRASHAWGYFCCHNWEGEGGPQWVGGREVVPRTHRSVHSGLWVGSAGRAQTKYVWTGRTPRKTLDIGWTTCRSSAGSKGCALQRCKHTAQIPNFYGNSLYNSPKWKQPKCPPQHNVLLVGVSKEWERADQK